MNLDEYNKLNWSDLDTNHKQNYIKLYFDKYTSQNTIRLSKEELTKIKLNSINGISSNYVASKINHDYINSICPICNKQFKLTHHQILSLKNNINKILFCSRRCASSYTTKTWHMGKSDAEWTEIKSKISDTLKSRELQLSDSYKQLRTKKLNAYWESMTPEQRSEKSIKAAGKNNIKGISKIEYEIAELLKTNNYIFKQPYYEHRLIFDFGIYLNNQLTLVEINGEYWHNYRPFVNYIEHIEEYNELLLKGIQGQHIAKKWRYKDVEKMNYCLQNNINYITIYVDRNDADEIYMNIIRNLNSGYVNIQLNNKM